MNIAIITDTYFPDINGVTSSIYTLALALRKRGHRVYIFAISNKTSTVIRRVSKNPPVFSIPSIPMLLVRPYRTTVPYSFRLVQILKRLKIDIIHTQTEFSMGLMGLSSSMTLHLPIVHTYHTMLEDYTHYILGGKVTKIITPEKADSIRREREAETAGEGKMVQQGILQFSDGAYRSYGKSKERTSRVRSYQTDLCHSDRYRRISV